MSLSHKFAREDAEATAKGAFNQFWSLYPRKVGKLDAIKAWKQVTRDFDPQEIIDGLRLNLPSLARKERQFIKHPGGWLRDGRWMDEPEENSPRQQQETDLQRMSREMRERNGRQRDEYRGDSEVVSLFPGEWEGR